jgi:3',5'-cyclic AMP phosphodiesterase CpdA
MGDHIMQLAVENPDVEFTVLAGHTHEGISKQLWKNLTVHVGGAEYSHPRFREVALPDEPVNTEQK